MVATEYEEAVINFDDYDEVKEGFPVIAADKYLGKVADARPGVSKEGRVNIQYACVLQESLKGDSPEVDRNGMEIRGKRVFDALYFVPNPRDKDGMLKEADRLAKDTAQLIGRFKTAMRGITGEPFTVSGTPTQIAAAAVDAIRGCTYVATVVIEKPNSNNGRTEDGNRITKHEPESEWSRED